jgi:transposase
MKKEKRMNKESRKKFVTIPYSKLIGQIRYKAREAGIFVFCYDESYTSKIDHFANEPLEHKNESEYLGKRGYIGSKKVSIKWFTSSTRKVIHADVNGAIGILRKFYLSDLFDSSEKHDEIVNLFRNSKKIHNPITINEQYDHNRVPDE